MTGHPDGTGTPTGRLSYIDIVLGNAASEAQRAELAVKMQRHGVGEDHPVLGVIAEMVLYRDQMKSMLTQMEEMARQAEAAGAAMYQAAVGLEKTAKRYPSVFQKVVEQGAHRLSYSVSTSHDVIISEINSIANTMRDELARFRSGGLGTREAMSRNGWLRQGWATIAVASLIALFVGTAIGTLWRATIVLGDCEVRSVHISDKGQRFALCE